jgi:hypothetical protein
MRKLVFGVMIIAALLLNVASASADGLYYLGNTANDSDVSGFVSMVKDPSGSAVTFGTIFMSSSYAITNYPTSSITDPALASTFSVSETGLSYFEATGLTDPEPIATTQVTATTMEGIGGNAFAQAFFFQTFYLTDGGIYTYEYVTGITSTYFAFPEDVTFSVRAGGYSKAKYGLGWWDPKTSGFVAGQFIESSFYEVPIGHDDVNAGLYGQLQWDFSAAPSSDALPAFFAYSESYAQVPEPATMLLLGLGLMGVAGIRRKFQK